MNTSEVLNKAADLIEERGWGRGTATWDPDQNQGVCIEGALIAALGIKVGGHNGDYAMEGAVYRNVFEACPAYLAVEAHLGREHGWLWEWNDDSDRTAAEVIEVLRAAALIEAAKENASAPVAEVVA